MNEVAIIFFLIFWVPSIIVIIKKYNFRRKATLVIGKVVDITPQYKSAKYTFEIDIDGRTETTTISPNTAFQTYKMNDEVALYRNRVNGKLEYRISSSSYVVPVVAMSASAFIFLMMLAGM
jgi:hypothetical protein